MEARIAEKSLHLMIINILRKFAGAYIMCSLYFYLPAFLPISIVHRWDEKHQAPAVTAVTAVTENSKEVHEKKKKKKVPPAIIIITIHKHFTIVPLDLNSK